MRIQESDEGTLTVTILTWWPGLVALLFAASAAGIWLRDPPHRGDGFMLSLFHVTRFVLPDA
jgi:hypothetical protein